MPAYVYGVYMSGKRIGPKYLERADAERAARRLLRDIADYLYMRHRSRQSPWRPPRVRVRRIVDR